MIFGLFQADCNDSSSSSRSRCHYVAAPERTRKSRRSRHASIGTHLNDSGIGGSTGYDSRGGGGGMDFQMVPPARFPSNVTTHRQRSKSLRHHSRSSAEIQDIRDQETPTPPPPPPPLPPLSHHLDCTLPRHHLPAGAMAAAGGFTFYDNKLSQKFQFGNGGLVNTQVPPVVEGCRSPPPLLPPPPVPGSGLLNNQCSSKGVPTAQQHLNFKALDGSGAAQAKYIDSKPSLIV